LGSEACAGRDGCALAKAGQRKASAITAAANLIMLADSRHPLNGSVQVAGSLA
jgi:hypothetical protein